MSDLIDVLPGVELPVSEVPQRLAEMWQGDATSPSEFRASQMNLVLHLGLNVTTEHARERFDTLIKFAQRYPSRIIVLCPTREETGGSMKAKLFSQCYIGESHREMCCCEALLLHYKSEDHGFLSNQVSVWLESDLPTYHWFSEVPAARIEKYFGNLLSMVRRTVYDSSIEPAAVAELEWPDPERVNDLARARILPVRQAIGQYLSGFEIGKICRNLRAVTVRYAEGLFGEAQHLKLWIEDCLNDCDDRENCEAKDIAYSVINCSEDGDCSMKLEFEYSDERYFRWRKFKEGMFGEIQSSIGGTEESISTRVKPLAPEHALSEALFF